MPRSEWGASARLGPAMRLPARGVFVHHTVTNHLTPLASAMRSIEGVGVTRFGRFSYSYCGHNGGGVAEGAGLTVGAHTGGFSADGAQWNRVALGYAFVGNTDTFVLSDTAVGEFAAWCQTMVNQGALVKDFFISPHRAVKATACPGTGVLARWGDLTSLARQPLGGDDMAIDVGSSGQAVEDLQGFLWLWVDPTIVVDGQFGNHTAAASHKLKAIIREGSSRSGWVDASSSAWSHRTFAVYAEWEQKMRAWLGAS